MIKKICGLKNPHLHSVKAKVVVDKDMNKLIDSYSQKSVYVLIMFFTAINTEMCLEAWTLM